MTDPTIKSFDVLPVYCTSYCEQFSNENDIKSRVVNGGEHFAAHKNNVFNILFSFSNTVDAA